MYALSVRNILISALVIVSCTMTEAIGGTFENPFGDAQPISFLFVSPAGDNSNPGTSTLPKLTIQAALTSATAGTAILVKAGTYRENISINRSGSIDRPIWIIAVDGFGTASINPPDAKSTIQGYGVHYIYIQGFHITAPRSGGTDDNGIKFAQASVDYSQPNSHIALLDNTVEVPANGESGIKISQTGYAHVVRNSILNPVVVGIDLGACQNSVIAWNYCVNTTVNGAFAIYAKGGSYNIQIHDNYSAGSKFGMFIGQSSAWQNVWIGNPAGPRAWEARYCQAYNNITRDNASQGYSFMGSIESKISNSMAYAAGWKPLTAQSNMVSLMEDGTVVPLLYANRDTVDRCAFDRTDWFWADAGCENAVSILDVKALRRLAGNSNDNTISGGFAIITSGGGRDTLILSPGLGITEITDFIPGTDIMRLVGFENTRLLNIPSLITQVGPHCVLQLPDGNALWFDSLQASNLSEANFDVRIPPSKSRLLPLKNPNNSSQRPSRSLYLDNKTGDKRIRPAHAKLFSLDGSVQQFNHQRNPDQSSVPGVYILKVE